MNKYLVMGMWVKLSIEAIWMDICHGGVLTSPHDQHIFIDSIVISKDYVGLHNFSNHYEIE